MIWALVRSGIFPNATQMARYMEISTKSIHRDLEFMREQLGFDIRYDAGRFGYYTPEGPVRCPFCEPDRKISSPAIAALRKPLVTFYGRCVGEKV